MKSILFLVLFVPFLAFAHGDHSTHNHSASPGGPLLNGYPWGLFSSSNNFEKRVTHKRNDQELVLANKIFELLASEDIVAFPLYLQHKSYRPFGDGQANAEASFGLWKKDEPPLMAVLSRSSQILRFIFHEDIIKDSKKVLVRFPDGKLKELGLTGNDGPSLKVNVSNLGWDSLDSGKTIFVKPNNWNDWFGIKFQRSKYDLDDLVSKVPSRLVYKTIPNPLKINTTNPTPPLLQLMNKAEKSNYKIFAADKVHSIYPEPNDKNFVHKSSGGNWTFLLNPSLWENNNVQKETFKQLYSCFEGRAYWEESTRKSVSGTSWHHVGDSGEIILNSIEKESRSLVTALAEPIVTPSGVTLAYGLNHIGYASLVRPEKAFISLKGQYHWHPVHTPEPICVEVWTPECKPSETNGFGFQCP